MLPVPISAAVPQSPYRFWNQHLRADVYDACILPTLQPCPSAHAVSPASGAWTDYTQAAQATFVNEIWHAPYRDLPECNFSRPFGPPVAETDDSTSAASTSAAPPPAKKRKTGCGRKRPIEGALRTYAVRMIPTPDQERELKRAFSASRHAYNSTVASIAGDWSRANFISRRNDYKDQCPDWAQTVSKTIKDGGVRQAVDAYSSNIAKWKKDNSHHFEVRFRSHRRTRTEVIRIEGDGDCKQKQSPLLAFRPVPFANNPRLRSECLAVLGTNFKAHGGIRLQDKPHVIAMLLAEGTRLRETCKIKWDKRTNSFHFLYVYDRAALPDPDPQFETKRVVATDLGISPPCTWFSPTTGDVGKPLKGIVEQLEERCFALDALTSRVARRGASFWDHDRTAWRTPKQLHRTFRNLKRKLARERARLRGWVAAAHYDLANHLLEWHDVVVCPKLKVAEMVPRAGRVFGNQSARSMLTFSHGLLVARLESAAFRWPGRHVLTNTGEPGTSKTCTCCGRWFAGLGGAKVYDCPHCGVSYDRDVGGARNNFFAAFGKAVGLGWDGQTN